MACFRNGDNNNESIEIDCEGTQYDYFGFAISGVDVKFPKKPYGTQKAVMGQVISALKNNKHCLVSSPTGTGKTLALVCSALAWQEFEQNRIDKAYAEEINKLAALSSASQQPPHNRTPEKSIKPGTSVTPDKLINQLPTYPGSPGGLHIPGASTSACSSPSIKPVFGLQNIYCKPECWEMEDLGNTTGAIGLKRNTSTEKSDDAPGSVKINKKQRRIENAAKGQGDPFLPHKLPIKERVPIIYYGSRTHKQLTQVIKEFATTHYHKTNMTILSSREYSCIKNSQGWETKNDLCRDCVKIPLLEDKNAKTSCRYYNGRAMLSRDRLGAAFDLDQLVEMGKTLNACPYYASRHLANTAKIVFCPYNYIIDPKIRDSMQINLKDNVVIIDEAHNIDDVCRDTATFVLKWDHLRKAKKELDDSKVADLPHITVLRDTLKKWDNWFHEHFQKAKKEKKIHYPWRSTQFANLLSEYAIGSIHYEEFSETAQSFSKQYHDDPRTLRGVTEATVSLIESLNTVLGYLFKTEQSMENFVQVFELTNPFLSHPDTHGHVSRSSGQTPSECSLQFLCMSASVVFAALREARSVVLASGTLDIASLALELALLQHQYTSASLSRTNPSDHVWAGVVSTYCNQELTLKYTSLQRTRVQDAIGGVAKCVARCTPHGVLAFLPSYELLRTLRLRWKKETNSETSLWKELENLKHVFFEEQNGKNHNEMMKEYYEKAKTDKGAILFAVYRGKVSEGVDFKDEQARAVIAFGVPYRNTKDIAVQEKMQYNDRQNNKGLSGKEWFEQQASKAVNQAVGRCVRHRCDWGAVVLVDARYRERAQRGRLSDWLQQKLLLNNDFEEKKLQAFMNLHKNRNEPDQFNCDCTSH